MGLINNHNITLQNVIEQFEKNNWKVTEQQNLENPTQKLVWLEKKPKSNQSTIINKESKYSFPIVKEAYISKCEHTLEIYIFPESTLKRRFYGLCTFRNDTQWTIPDLTNFEVKLTLS